MNRTAVRRAWILPLVMGLVCGAQQRAAAQEGPFDPEDWPETADDSALVHYVTTDGSLAPLGDEWLEGSLQILSGGDQVTEPLNIGGFDALKVLGNYLNIADAFFEDWAEHEVIDILVQVYGDGAVLAADGTPRNFSFLTGTLPDLNFPVGGSIPVECRNRQWNWFLFRIVNAVRPDGTLYVGSIPANAQGGTGAGGVNGGTIRFEGVPGLTVRAVAFGEEGAFGEPDQINVCGEAEPCPPEPETNLAWIDINAGTSDHLEIIEGGQQSVSFEADVGPADDRRSVVRPELYFNFGITDNYLGEPCNEPRTVKVCVEFYDEPGLEGTLFGPDTYATDDQGGMALAPLDARHVLEGTDTWIRRSWILPAVSLAGIETAPLTGGPRFISEGEGVAVSWVGLAILRTGDHPLSGQDPLSDCYADQLICTDAYGNYAELDLNEDLQDGLAPGNSGGDQEMITEEAGPEDDRRLAVRPAFDDGNPGFTHQYVNLALVDEPFGPSTQPNAHLAICVTYYDDPALAGATFRPEVFQTELAGQVTLGFTSGAIAVALEGTDEWRDAYFEIPAIKFNGVNQGPQAAARFVMSDKVFLTRVRYAVIRPCGPQAGVNRLEECKPAEPEVSFQRGDADGNGVIDQTDAIGLLSALFLGQGELGCEDAADTDDDGQLAITDAIFTLGYLFAGGPEPPAPFPECGPDPTEDELACEFPCL